MVSVDVGRFGWVSVGGLGWVNVGRVVGGGCGWVWAEVHNG